MISGFRSKALRRFWEKSDSSGLRSDWVVRIDLILDALERAATPEDMNIHQLDFHALRGSMAGRFAVRVSRNWRITFGWSGQDAIEVDLEDYHGR